MFVESNNLIVWLIWMSSRYKNLDFFFIVLRQPSVVVKQPQNQHGVKPRVSKIHTSTYSYLAAAVKKQSPSEYFIFLSEALTLL